MKRILITAAAAMIAGYAHAFINPNFTPLDLIENADTILLVNMKPADAKGKTVGEVKRVLKGAKPEGGKVTIDLSTCPKEDYAKQIKDDLEALGGEEALLFLGKDEQGEEAAFLQISAGWYRMVKTEGFQFELDDYAERMLGTWAGSTDMLLGCVEYILNDPSAEVPVCVGANWGDKVLAGKVAGKIHDLQIVDVEGKGDVCLFVASEGGDKLFKYDKGAKKFADVTEKHGLSTKSQSAVWGDFNGDGRLDLASSAGLGIYLQQADGKFGGRAGVKPDAVKEVCTGLAVLDAGQGGKAGLLVTTPHIPLVLVPGGDGTFSVKALARQGASGDLGAAGKSLVADFDGDNLPDILQLFAKGSWLYRGKGKGEFAEGARCDVCLGPDRSSAAVGDFDADGRMDVLSAGSDRPRLWHNIGGGKFHEVLMVCGSLAYITKPDSFACGTCDINNDGRQDLYLLYTAGVDPQIFFNRGFRCFGYAIEMCARFNEVLEDAAKGQQAGAVGDVDGDSRQDLALALVSGEIWTVFRAEEDHALGVTAELPLKGRSVGPVSVSGQRDKQRLGAWNVAAGGIKAFFGMSEPGPCTIKWQLPGGKPQEKQVVVEDKALRVTLQ